MTRAAKMDSAEAIKQYVAYSHPFVFRLSPSVDLSEFQIKYAELSEYAHEVAKSFLGKDTIRYQSILMSVSLLAALIYAFNLETVEVFDQMVRVDTTFLVFLTAFAAGVSLILIGKSIIDYKTHKITEDPQKSSVNAATEMIKTGRKKVEIDNYFWIKVVNLIGQMEAFYQGALGAMENTAPNLLYLEVWQKLTALDIQNRKRHKDLRDTIESRERSFAKIEESVLYDWSEFQGKVTGVPAGDSNGRSIFTKARDETLQKWIDARRELADVFKMAVGEYDPELAMINRVTRTLNLAKRLRLAVIWLEVLVPVVLAIAVISIVWLG